MFEYVHTHIHMYIHMYIHTHTHTCDSNLLIKRHEYNYAIPCLVTCFLHICNVLKLHIQVYLILYNAFIIFYRIDVVYFNLSLILGNWFY